MGNSHPFSSCCIRGTNKQKEKKEASSSNNPSPEVKDLELKFIQESTPHLETNKNKVFKKKDSILNETYFVYQLGDLLGIGPNGVVYECMNIDNEKLYACKYISCKAETRGKIIDYLKGKLLDVSHGNLINYKTIAESPQNSEDIMIAGELVSGGSLDKLLLNLKVLDEKTVKLIIKQMLNGIHCLNTQGKAHNNLHTNNILFDLYGRVKLSDYFSLNPEEINRDTTNMSIKNFYYQAPETILFQKHAVKTDIWSIGCIAYEMATGLKPWNEHSTDFDFIKKELENGNLYKFPDNISKSLKIFLEKTLQIDESKRSSALELMNDEFIINEVSDSEDNNTSPSQGESNKEFKMMFSNDFLGKKDDNDLAKYKNLLYRKLISIRKRTMDDSVKI